MPDVGNIIKLTNTGSSLLYPPVIHRYGYDGLYRLTVAHGNFGNYAFIKRAAERQDYEVRRWRSCRGSRVALYPNLTTLDPVWRRLNRDLRYRRALSGKYGQSVSLADLPDIEEKEANFDRYRVPGTIIE